MSGSPVETELGPSGVSHMVGLVSNKNWQVCVPHSPRLVRVDTEQVIQWVAAVTSENIRVTDVL